ncbi:MAG: DUF1932 domain-containing protein [Alphaproteobacteria bacterium]
MKLTIIGFGEAGRAIAQGLREEAKAPEISCFDIKTNDPAQAEVIEQAAESLKVRNCATLEQAVEDAGFLISTVTAGSAMDVARAVCDLSPPAKAFFDMNSVAPGTKRAEAELIESAGIAYVDTAVMAPIHPRLHKTPMLLAGPAAEDYAAVLTGWNMDVRVVGEAVGRASSIKMLRSVMIKGLEALTAEMGLAAEKAGVSDEVIGSLNASFPGIDWAQRTAYNLERMTTHGIRRAEEMEEVVKTLEELGISPELSRGTVKRQRRFGESKVILNSDELSLKINSHKIFAKMDEF